MRGRHAIRLLVLDADGVLTDGRLYFGPRGEALKVFHVRDGYGIRALMAELRDRLDLSCQTVTGKSLADGIDGAKVHRRDVIHSSGTAKSLRSRTPSK